MNTVHTGVTAVITGNSDINVLAHLVSAIDFDTLKIATRGKLSVTEEAFEKFITGTGKALMDAGLLDEEFGPTNSYVAALN